VRRARFHLRFTPTYSSWLNQVERWFALITNQAIRRGSFDSVVDLKRKINEFVEHYNQRPRPFAWTATADCEKVHECARPNDQFERYLMHLADGLWHADRHAGLKGYCTGLMLPLARKSVEPMAARIDHFHASARHQALHHFVAKAEWSDAEMLHRVAQWVVPKMDFAAGGFWIIDNTGFPKKGRHSVGVTRQYCGVLSK